MRRLGHILLLALGLVAVSASIAAAHPEPGDVDGDGVRDERDNCAQTRNGDQANADGDGLGDRCDVDADGDGVANSTPYVDRGPDNCPLVPNADQQDDGPEGTPANGIGDACDRDSDGDSVTDVRDNCPASSNRDQADYDYDRTGDICDPDDDEDGEFDDADNCVRTYNYDQADLDGDGRGTACDDDERAPGGGGGGGSGGDGGDPQGSSRDRAAPTLELRLARTQRLSELGAGLPVEIRCSEACAVTARLEIDRATARRLRIGRRATTVARGAAALAGQGRTYVFMRFKRGTARRLARGSGVRARLSLTATDEAGNRRTAHRTLRLRR